MEFPEPVIEIAIEPKSKADQEKLGLALAKLAAEDPSFRVDRPGERPDHHSRAWANCISTSRSTSLRATYKVDANIGAPQVAYRETITKKVEVDYTHKKQTGGTGQFARVKLVIEPNETGGLRVRIEGRRRRGSEGIHPRRRKGPQQRHDLGSVIAGFPVVDVKVTLIDGAYHEVDSSAFWPSKSPRAPLPRRSAEGRLVLLEPIMKVEVVTPEDYTGSVIGDLNSRRGQIQGRTCAATPWSSTRWCRSPTCSVRQQPALDEPGPCGNYTMQFDHYEQVPRRSPPKSRSQVRLIP
jgi:elongation factor G